jgi:hypothetical protein
MFLNIKLTLFFSTFCLLINHNLSPPTSPALLYIHRCFFAHALSSNPSDPIKSQYAPSFLAGYRSACNIVGSVKLQFKLFPARIARFWVLWTHAFSASVCLFFLLFLKLSVLISFIYLYRSCWHLLLRMVHVLMLRLLLYRNLRMLAIYLRVPLFMVVELSNSW